MVVLPKNVVYELDVGYPCSVCGVDSGELCLPVRGLTRDMVASGYVHMGRRVRRLLDEKRRRRWL